jgi:hypothetical protein
MAFTQGEINELKKAIATGALTVKYTGDGGTKEVTYRSLLEMRTILAMMEEEVNPSTDPCAPGNFVFPSFSRGHR